MLGCNVNNAAYQSASGSDPTTYEGSLTDSDISTNPINVPFKKSSGLQIMYVINPSANKIIE